MTPEQVRARRTWGQIVFAVVFLLFGVNALAQVTGALAGSNADTGMLTAWQVLVGVAGLSASVGSWRGDRWAPHAALAYGVITGTMIVSLGWLLDLEPDAQPGLFAGGASVLLVGVGAAWYLRRVLRQGT